MLLLVETASDDRSAPESCSIVMVACSAKSHLPPFVIRFTDSSRSSPAAASVAASLLLFAAAGTPQNTAMRPEHELLVTCDRRHTHMRKTNQPVSLQVSTMQTLQKSSTKRT